MKFSQMTPEVAYNLTCLCYEYMSEKELKKCQEVVCKDPEYAYWFAKNIPVANIEKCEEIACKDPQYAYWFARDIRRANIEKCKEAACKDPHWAYYFARDIK